MLKPIHELAAVKDGNIITGFLLGSMSELVSVKEMAFKKAYYVDIEKMIELVQKEQVQNLVWDRKRERIAVQYTHEEVEFLYSTGSFTRTSLNSMIEKQKTLRDYLRNDMIITKRHLDFVFAKKGIAGYFIGAMQLPLGLFGDKYYTLYIVGNMSRVQAYLETIDKKYKRFIQFKPQENTGVLVLPSVLYNGLAQSLNLMVNCSMLNRDKVEGFAGLLLKQGEKAKEDCRIIEMNNSLILNRLI